MDQTRIISTTSACSETATEHARLSVPQKLIESAAVRKSQRIHFWIFYGVPAVGAVLAVLSLAWFPVGVPELAALTGLWLLTGTGVTVGFHRLFTHRAFSATPWVRSTLAITGMMAALGPLISWVAIHRRHHELSDREGDPHSPRPEAQGLWGSLNGLWHAHMGWMLDHDYPNPMHYAPELMRDPRIRRLSRAYPLWVLLGLVVAGLVGAALRHSWIGFLTGILWGGLFRLFVVQHVTCSVNSLCHAFGARPFRTREESRNVAWLAIPTLGESWHNNHHAFQFSAMFGQRWWEVDIGGAIILLLRGMGVVSNVRTVSPDIVRRKAVGEAVGPAQTKEDNGAENAC